MNLELVAANAFGKSQYERENCIIHYKFYGDVNIEKIKEILAKTLKFSENNKVLGIHADIIELKGSFSLLDEYLAKEYYHILRQRGLKSHSMIVSQDIFAKYAAQRLIQKTTPYNKAGFVMQTFNNLEEGYKWVLKNTK
jgi:hypothetical protein